MRHLPLETYQKLGLIRNMEKNDSISGELVQCGLKTMPMP